MKKKLKIKKHNILINTTSITELSLLGRRQVQVKSEINLYIKI